MKAMKNSHRSKRLIFQKIARVSSQSPFKVLANERYRDTEELSRRYKGIIGRIDRILRNRRKENNDKNRNWIRYIYLQTTSLFPKWKFSHKRLSPTVFFFLCRNIRSLKRFQKGFLLNIQQDKGKRFSLEDGMNDIIYTKDNRVMARNPGTFVSSKNKIGSRCNMKIWGEWEG